MLTLDMPLSASSFGRGVGNADAQQLKSWLS